MESKAPRDQTIPCVLRGAAATRSCVNAKGQASLPAPFCCPRPGYAFRRFLLLFFSCAYHGRTCCPGIRIDFTTFGISHARTRQ